MRNDKLWIFVIFAAVLLAVMAFNTFSGGQDHTPATGPAGQRASGDFLCGISLQLHSGNDEHPFETYIDEIADAGANTVCLVVAAYQENCASSSLFVDARKTPSDRRLTQLIDHAHERGLRVVLMPIVLLDNPLAGEWRGKIAPTSWDDWWEDYTDYLVHYARLAEKTGVDVLMIGSELLSTERSTDRWEKLIGTIRYDYHGLLSYSTNWDHYQAPKFWEHLDLIGMTTYYDLTGGKAPALERLLAAWEPIRRDIHAWQAKIGRPIMFTEVGWPNLTTCAQYPWNYTLTEKGPDPAAQANCFEAFFRTWIDDPIVAGIMVWEWRNYPGQPTGPTDTSYVPCGKLALEVISRYYRAAQLATTRPATQPAETADPVTR